MTVESARREHLGAVAALEREFFGAPASEAQLARAMERGDTVLLCALGENGTLLGCADFQFVLDEGYIGNVAVQSAHRRQGIGEALMRAMIAEARARSLAFLTLEVRESNAAARALYEKCGFTVVGLRRNYYEKPTENAVLMTLNF